MSSKHVQYHDHFTEIGTHFLWKHPASISLPTYIQATIYKIDSSETATFWDLFNRIIFLFRYRLHRSTKISSDFFINQPINSMDLKKKKDFVFLKKWFKKWEMGLQGGTILVYRINNKSQRGKKIYFIEPNTKLL